MTWETLRRAGLILILATVAVGPFFQGLFFPHQQHVAQAAIGLAFLCWLLGRIAGGHTRQPAGLDPEAPASPSPGVDWRDPLTLTSLALVGWYLVASGGAVYPQGHLEVVLNLAATLLAFLAVRAETRAHPGLPAQLALLLAAAGIGVALVSLAPYVGLATLDPEMVQALALVGGDGRLGGPFQYWNTAAIYFLAVLLLITGLAAQGPPRQPPRPWPLVLAAAAGYVPMLAFILAASRGAVLTLPVAVALFLAGLPRGRRLTALLLFLVATVPALAASRGFAANAALHDTPRVLKWYLAGQAAAVLGGMAVALWVRFPGRVRAGLAGAGTLAAAGLAGWWAMQVGGLVPALERVLPAHARRLLDITWRTPNALLRLYYDRDALRILRDHPLLGAGGRGWERLYFQYQDFYYYASEVHNGYLQTAVEAGLPALAALVAFSLAVLWQGWRCRRTSVPGWSLAAAALAILGHSVIDFNLSYLSILLVVWCAAAAIPTPAASGTPPAADTPAGTGRPPVGRRALAALPWAGVAAALLFTLAASTQAYAAHSLRLGERLAGAGRWAEAAAAFARAARWAPLAAAPWDWLARAHAGQPQELTYLAAAIRRDPENHLLYRQLADAHRFRGDRAAEAEAALAALQRQPAYYEHYERAMAPLMEEAIAAVLDGRRQEGLALAEQARALGDELVRRRQETEGRKHLWPHAQPPLTPAFQLRYGQALALTGQLEAALPYLQAAGETLALRVQADIWTYLVLEKLGRPADPNLVGRPWIRALPFNPLREVLEKGAGA